MDSEFDVRFGGGFIRLDLVLVGVAQRVATGSFFFVRKIGCQKDSRMLGWGAWMACGIFGEDA